MSPGVDITNHGRSRNLTNFLTVKLRRVIKLERLLESWQKSEGRDRALRLVRFMRLRLQHALGRIAEITTRLLRLAFQCIAVSLNILQRTLSSLTYDWDLSTSLGLTAVRPPSQLSTALLSTTTVPPPPTYRPSRTFSTTLLSATAVPPPPTYGPS